jgi:hypothetical protein
VPNETSQDDITPEAALSLALWAELLPGMVTYAIMGRTRP